MSEFYSLKDIAHAQPWQVGEMAQLLHQLQDAGYAIPESWVLPTECFQRSLQKLISREPVFADWPQLLWQLPTVSGYIGQNFAKRLRTPLLGLSLDLPLDALLSTVKSPVVRVLPSFWFGDRVASGDFVEMVEAPICWAEAAAVEAAIKQVWAELFSARSLAYWAQRWQALEESASGDRISLGIALIIQAVEPTQLSGTCTVRPEKVEIQVVQGLPKAIAESYPDHYQGLLPQTPPLAWRPGYQEQSYQPADANLSTASLDGCVTTVAPPFTVTEILSPEVEGALLRMARSLQNWAERPLRVEWVLPMRYAAPLQIAQALWWPLVSSAEGLEVVAPPLSRELSGRPASPGQVVGVALVIKPGEALPPSANQHILVASEVAPDWLPLLKTAAAVISEKGGLTSHAAILARELQLPAVVGVKDVTQYLQTGDALRIDGDRGVVEPLATPPPEITTPPPLPQVPEFDHQTEIWLNLSQPDLAEAMATLPVAGVGLLRSEWLIIPALDRRHPYHWLDQGEGDILLERIVAQLRPIVKAFSPRPVRYRTLDIRSSDFAQLQGAPAVEPNPMLGVRGTFSYRQHPEYLRLELRVLQRLQAEGYSNLQLLLPFVRSVEEVQFCQQMIREVGLHQVPSFELWIMAEVPSVLFLMPQYVAAGVQGIAIGTNDLTQLLLGIDREQSRFSDHFDESHPAVQAAIAHLIQQAHTLHIPCTLCGVAPAHHPTLITTLVQQGITGISVDAAAVETTARTIQRVEA